NGGRPAACLGGCGGGARGRSGRREPAPRHLERVVHLAIAVLVVGVAGDGDSDLAPLVDHWKNTSRMSYSGNNSQPKSSSYQIVVSVSESRWVAMVNKPDVGCGW